MENQERSSPESSFIEKCSFNSETEVLTINFKRGEVIHYELFDKWEELKQAESVGKFYHAEIKGKYNSININQ